jgi:hypothetical protein
MSPTSYQYKITRLTPYWSQQTASGVTPVVNCTRPSVTTGVTLCQPRVYHFGSSSNNLPSNNAWNAARYVLPGVTGVRGRPPRTQGLKIPCSTLIRTPELQIRNLLADSNWRHRDFQSPALPTELWLALTHVTGVRGRRPTRLLTAPFQPSLHPL